MSTVKDYDLAKYKFAGLIEDLYGVRDLTTLHLLDPNLSNSSSLIQSEEADTIFHKKFYKKLNEGWQEIIDQYHEFIQNEVSPWFEDDFLFQAFPSFRVQVPNQTAVSKWPFDSDPDHGHPDWEINFQVAITNMVDTSATWLESVPGLSDFKPLNLNAGQYAIFNGNKCRHGNKANKTGLTRVSFDFRVLPINRYDENTDKKSYYGRKFVDGGYYRRYRRGDV